jgi:threonine dehydrogenase-like Zn-dependent dehydrogenase
MKAAVWYGGQDIRIENRPKPTIGPEDVLVKVKAVGICGSELHAYKGLSKRRVPPLIMGHEFAGLVEEVGDRSAGLGVGDRVTMNPAVPCGLCEQCVSGRMNLCRTRTHVGLDFPGAFADYVKAAGRAFHRIPDSVSFEEATLAEPLSVGIHTANVSNMGKGETVLILGSGVIGLSCLIAARERAGRILVSDIVRSRLDFARSFGADAVIDASKVDPVEEIRRLTGGRGVDIAMEAVGLEKTVGQAISSVKEGGVVATVGLLDETIRINVLQIVLKELQLRGSYGRTEDDFTQALTILERDTSRIRRLITQRFSLDDVLKAFETVSDAEQNAVKVVLIP